MHSHDDLLDADAAAANRRELKRTIVISTVALVLVLVASSLILLGGIPA